MPTEFLELLKEATGRSEYVIVVNLDIRGFTPFCQTVDSVDVATYITKVYTKIINSYFSDAPFYKPAGDGLIITIPYDAEILKKVATSTITSCLKLVENFGALCKGEHMINFPTPQKIGIGITRGSACCIHSEDEILDYSGKTLNLAARLMDMARPSGIVLDAGFGFDLLPNEIKELFSEEMVYIRGIAEEDPIKVYFSKRHTVIPDLLKKPLKEPELNVDRYEYLFSKIKRLGTDLRLTLSRKPLDEDEILVTICHPDPEIEEFWVWHYRNIGQNVSYHRRGKTHTLRLDARALIKMLESTKATEEMKIVFEVTYPV